MASYFSFAVPVPPLMIAPAWPMRRPGGAVCPAMKPTTGLRTCADELRGLLFGVAADFADHDDGVRVGIVVEKRMASRNDVPIIGSPPMPMQVDWPMPRCVSWSTAS